MDHPERKHIRLPDFDYSLSGAYFITICAKDRRKLFSDIIMTESGVPTVRHTSIGNIVKEQILALENRFKHVFVARYVIMPDHIHMILHFIGSTEDSSLREDLNAVICAFKSLTVRSVKQCYPQIDGVFQTSYYDHVIRNRQDYEEKAEYIQNNAMKWYYEHR